MKRLLVVGTGSIARRHLELADAMYSQLALTNISTRGCADAPQGLPRNCEYETTLEAALRQHPQMAVVASPAPWHLQHSEQLLAAGVPVLVEKPLAESLRSAEQFRRDWSDNHSLGVAYVLRFSPLVQACKERLDSGVLGALLGVQINTGQYLPDWRSGIDYRESVSAQRALGGGVLLELSHELDLINWLLGPIDSVSAAISQSSRLEIDVEDQADVLLKNARGVQINLHLDMLQRTPRREWLAICEEGCLRMDLVAETLQWVTSAEEGGDVEDFCGARDAMYRAQLRAFVAMTDGAKWPGADLDAALQALRLVELIRMSDREQRWISMDERLFHD